MKNSLLTVQIRAISILGKQADKHKFNILDVFSSTSRTVFLSMK